jgi:hypothetical protein
VLVHVHEEPRPALSSVAVHSAVHYYMIWPKLFAATVIRPLVTGLD